MTTKGKKLPTRAKDLTGQRFGKLVVVERSTIRKKTGAAVWRCICNCGNESHIIAKSLVSNSSRSCGKCEPRWNVEDLTGQRFGRLAVTHHSGKNKWGGNLWHCICDCGNEKDLTTSHLKNPSVISCGCFRRERNPNFGSITEPLDLRGRRFGDVVAIEPTDGFRSRSVEWHIRCD